MATLSKQASSSISMDRNQTRLNALGRVFAKTVRIITGRRDINVVMTTSGANQMPSGGFSDGKTIYVNTNMIEDLSKPIGLVRLMAVVYHEMCHLMLIMPRTAGVSSNSLTLLTPRRPKPRTVAR